jgi:hypothetical protein
LSREEAAAGCWSHSTFSEKDFAPLQSLSLVQDRAAPRIFHELRRPPA